MFASQYGARLTLSIAGPQHIAIDLQRRPEGGYHGGQMVIITGGIRIYVGELRALLPHHEAWNAARTHARTLFNGPALNRPWSTENVPPPVIAQLKAHPDATWSVQAVNAHASLNRQPVINVRVGALTICCHDRQSVSEMVTIWNEAFGFAAQLWADPAPSPHPPHLHVVT